MYFNHDGFRYTFYRFGFQKRITCCRISLEKDGKEDKILTVGEARLNPKDKWNKSIGRRVALQKALDSLDCPHFERVKINQILDDIEKLEAQGL